MKSVLCVDDDPAMGRAIARILRYAGRFEVTSASSGTEAVILLKARRFDLVLLDLVLPDCVGLEILDHILPPRPAVIAMAASPGTASRAVAIERGCCGFLVKPFLMETLFAEVRRVLER